VKRKVPLKRLNKIGSALVVCLALAVSSASAQTDITSTISTLSGYWDGVLVIAIGIMLFVVGRKVVKKL